jgi:hypothetical protein
LKSRTANLRVAALYVGLALGATVLPNSAAANPFPAPYVSRALDAVLLPIDNSVIDAFDLKTGTMGVLVLSTQPGGVAEAAGFRPGDVIASVKNRKVTEPIQIDEIVLYWITNGITDFGFDTWRAGAPFASSWIITEDYYYELIDVTTVSTWSSYSSDSFSYESYSESYSETFVESYEYSEFEIEETVTSEEFYTEVTSETSDEMTTEETDEATDETSGEQSDEASDEASDDQIDVDAGDVMDGDDAGDEAGSDDTYDAGDDTGGDDMGGDDTGGDEDEG